MSDESLRKFTKSELFSYCKSNADKMIISIHENVYDVTKFADEHPGGEEVLKEHQIKNETFIDATEAFEDVGHSMDARDLMKKYIVGKLATTQQPQPNNNQNGKSNKEDNCCVSSCWLKYVIPVVVVAAAIYFYKFR